MPAVRDRAAAHLGRELFHRFPRSLAEEGRTAEGQHWHAQLGLREFAIVFCVFVMGRVILEGVQAARRRKTAHVFIESGAGDGGGIVSKVLVEPAQQ